MGESSGSWLRRGQTIAATDDAGAVLRAWRTKNGQSQTAVAELLNTTQQHLSQIEKRTRPLSLEQRRRIVAELGIPAGELGLSSGQACRLMPSDDTSSEVVVSQMEWRAQRRWLNKHRAELARLAVQFYPPDQRVLGTPLVADAEWLPATPIELGTIGLELDERPQVAAVDGSEPESSPIRPLRSVGVRFDRYTSALKHLDSPQLFESRPSYRLLDASLADRRLGFGLAAYFDKLDISETLGHELAAACMAEPALLATSPSQLHSRLPFRNQIGDPFDSQRRAIIPAITTLTIRLRRYPAKPSFLLHWRDPTKVATAGGIYDVVPAGEFQPSSVALWDRGNDLDLWRNVVREYSEELLGLPEHDGTRSQPIDYENWPLYQLLEKGMRDGSVTAHFLGLGLDVLTLAATILTVVVIDDDAFGQAFGSIVRYNDEGEIVGTHDDAAEGVPFTKAAVDRLLSSEPMASPGAACLSLAWEHRGTLLGV
ncbi:MAG: helix-turn-helix domain-containing protein [Actinomycetota bacterium]|nr:helix-turn-helix domain-containing protein [Actinomycetota bacterium]